MIAPYLAPGVAILIVAGIASVVLYRATYQRERMAWQVVGLIGIGLVGAAIVVDLAVRSWEPAIIGFVWPLAPGLMAIDAAWRGLRAPAA